MVKLPPFAVEHWMDEHETQEGILNLAETCCESISIADLEALSENVEATRAALDFKNQKLLYGEIRGSSILRGNLANLYSARSGSGQGLTKDGILITNGAIVANFLVGYSMLEKGDHAICVFPTYESLYEVPRSFGVEVDMWSMDPKQKWALSIEDLKKLIKDNTKMIILNNPNNPTGAIIAKSQLEEIIDLAREKDITILADEVYRPIFHSISPGDDDFPPSAINMGYDKVIVTGSFSKAYSMAGIRVGWVACKNQEIIERIAATRHYTTISVSLLDQAVAAEAISDRCIHALLGRNIQLAKKNLEVLSNWVEEHNWACNFAVKPKAGTTCLLKFQKMGKPIDDVAFCLAANKYGVMFVPASHCFGVAPGHVRVGFVCSETTLRQGLDKLREFMEDEFADLPTVKVVRDK